ncbi:hypothetical protein [Streptomyces sp. H27-S2]|uniref:hypothetical protein n=1 Tax=Streptomyces antarcticus TaxID=2996458 RepID=UPI00226FFD50|nr:hypothetical protein [Streptomyces sp. H27-S2]MCY0951001.1 hypothetical protein [Streptomyces sp. H27-S2]
MSPLAHTEYELRGRSSRRARPAAWGVEVARDASTGEVHALRPAAGGFAGVQSIRSRS